ncbi:MAG: ClcB-like voltage-gated chloride channel protein [Candidimonas sp.]
MIWRRIRARWNRLTSSAWLSNLPAMLCWAALAGAAGAGATIAFHEAIYAIQFLTVGRSGSITEIIQSLPWYGRLLMPALGGLAAGLLLWTVSGPKAPKQADYMEAVAIGDGRMPIVHGLVRSLSSLFTVVSGGSIGREGAMVHLASLSASVIGRFTSFNRSRLRLLVACGAAAGVASAYGAPLAGTVFVAEIVLGTTSMSSFGAMLVAAASASITMHLSGHYETLYPVMALSDVTGPQALPFILLGVVAGLAAPPFLRSMELSRRAFLRTGLSLPVRLSLGGLLLGMLLVFMPEVSGNGYEVVQSLLGEPWTWYAIVLVLACKVLATALTVGSGGIGGVFTPALFVGAALGALFGKVMIAFWPSLATSLDIYVLVGMGSFLGTAAGAPLMAILMIFEMTLSYQIVLPLMLACVVAYFASRALAEAGMYEIVLLRERDAALRRSWARATVADLVQPAQTVLSPDARIEQALQLFLDHPVKYIYVVDDQDVYKGAIAQRDLTSLLLGRADVQSLRASDVLRLDCMPVLYPDFTVDQAVAYFVQFRGERMPVVSREESGKLLGVVHKSEVLKRYREMKRPDEASSDVALDYSWRRGRR